MKDLTGKVFGRLTAIKPLGRTNKGLVLWECICTCGNTKTVRGVNLTKGTKSCGCLVKERLQAQGSHNHCRRGEESLTWRSWKSMLNRVEPAHKSHAYYYDKGIGVCSEWHEFSVFLVDMGERVKGTTLDRVDNTKGYCPDNCRWATKKQQANNRTCMKTYTYEGDTKSLTDWSEDPRCKVSKPTLYARVLKYNAGIETALTTPLKGRLK